MTPELERQLCLEFPATFAALARRTIYDLGELLQHRDIRDKELIQMFGIEHGDGWYGILHRFAAKMEPWCRETGSHITQCKEKFGSLTIYFHVEGRETSETDWINRVMPEEPTPGNDTAYVDLREAEDESLHTCELCGAPGQLREHDHWWSTRCDECDSPALRTMRRIANAERFIKYIVEPHHPEEVEKWRERLRDRY